MLIAFFVDLFGNYADNTLLCQSKVTACNVAR